MDAEEARKALDLARKHDENGNTAAALKWARKSVAIYSTPEAMALFTRLREKGAQGEPNRESNEASQASEPPPPLQPSNVETVYTSRETHTSKDGREYTEQQVEVVRRVKRAGGDFYAVLNIQKSASDSEVKKSYKKLHPDKNGAPGADEAFKLVSKAFTVLSDRDKRSMYDKFGGDPESRFGSASASGAAHPFSQFQGTRMRPGMGAEVDAEDLFNMFFGGGMGNGPFGATPVFTFGGPGMRTHYYRPGGAGARARQAGAQAAQQNQTAMWFQVLPLLILLFFTLLSYLPNLFMVSDPDFRWRPTPMHRAQRTTLDRGISYYVDPVAFAKHPYVKATTTSSGHGGNVQRFSREKSSPELRGFERRVEEAWMKELYRQCDSALEHKRRRMMDAQGFFGIGADKAKMQRIQAEVYEKCEQLENLFGISLR